ncbi:hypothetical protein H5S39_01195, partial [Limosilactobacillus sp. STM3_1]|nr:hypothetical protein [Limosilactobacillus rudii]
MMKNTKKFLTTTAVIATALTGGGGLTASTVHADVKPAAGEATTNDAIEQAKDKVAHATTA